MIGRQLPNSFREAALLIQEWLFKSSIVAKKITGFPWRHESARLDAPLIVSLTSYPGRYDVLPWTIYSLLQQSVRPCRLILWIAHSDVQQLPPRVLDLQEFGLEIRHCDDFGSYKKLIPTLREYPEAYVVTADDDIYYPANWLSKLLGAVQLSNGNPIAHRVHRLKIDSDGSPLSYKLWDHCIPDIGIHPRNFGTTGAGMLFPPRVFKNEMLEDEKFLEYCPTADDIWVHWMLRLNQLATYSLGNGFRIRTWRIVRRGGTLFKENVQNNGNDRQALNLYKEFGYPSDFQAR